MRDELKRAHLCFVRIVVTAAADSFLLNLQISKALDKAAV